MKAKAHINRSFGARDLGNFEEAALWAASALELLAKAALAKVNPLLVADPQDDGRSLMIAAGLSSDFTRFKSVPAKGLFSRCAKAFRPFNEQEAGRIATQRNEELHSALAPFTDLDEDIWWGRYWSQAIILIHAQDEDVATFVGQSRAGTVEAHLQRNSENIARRLEVMIERAKHRQASAASSQDARAEIAALLARPGHLGEFSAPEECPACGAAGLLLGDDILSSDVEFDYNDGTALELLTVAVDAFECEECALRLPDPEYISESTLPESFDSEREYEPVFDDYGND